MFNKLRLAIFAAKCFNLSLVTFNVILSFVIQFFVILSFAVLSLSGCGGSSSSVDSSPQPNAVSDCGPFSNWQTSNYVLPYAVATSYFLNQSNCSGFGHSGFWTYGYDFTMDIGTEVTAMSDGLVVHIQNGTSDGDSTGTNLILIEHQDGTIALYSHLTNNGIFVSVGESVVAGNILGLSGNSGNTGGLPHLHVSLHPCIGLPGLIGVPTSNCPTQPFNFRNTEANSAGLIARRRYLALAF